MADAAIRTCYAAGMDPDVLRIKTRLYSGNEIAMGPGKADLLEAIAQHGSISAAGRALGMSYRRTWLLVDAMNRCWREPLVQTAAGGSHGGGAQLTPLGHSVLGDYRALQKRLSAAAADAPEQAALVAALLPDPRPTRD